MLNLHNIPNTGQKIVYTDGTLPTGKVLGYSLKDGDLGVVVGLKPRMSVYDGEKWVGKHIAIAVYDFAKEGGAIGTIALDAIVPKGAVITRSYFFVNTQLTSDGSAQIALTTGEGAGDIVAAAVLGTNGTAGVHEGVSTGTAATMKTMTADRTISVVISVADLTAGKLTVFCEYVMP